MQTISNKTNGFTIIEILVVIMLIGILAVFTVPRFLGVAEEGKWNAAKPKMALLEQDLSMFMVNCGRYPTQAEGLKALRTAPPGLAGKWKGPYGKESDLDDPWDNQFEYFMPGQKNPNTYDIVSYGQDGQPGGEGNDADIFND